MEKNYGHDLNVLEFNRLNGKIHEIFSLSEDRNIKYIIYNSLFTYLILISKKVHGENSLISKNLMELYLSGRV